MSLHHIHHFKRIFIYTTLISVMLLIIVITINKTDKKPSQSRVVIKNANISFKADARSSTKHSIFEISSKFKNRPYKGLTIQCEEKDEYIDTTGKHFDCMTFVENVLAMHMIQPTTQYEQQKQETQPEYRQMLLSDAIQSLRYKNSENSCTSRNHFLYTDWLENNSQYFADITAYIAKDISKIIKSNVLSVKTAKIDKANWFNHNFKIKTKDKVKTVNIDYISFDNLLKVKNDQLVKILPNEGLAVIVHDYEKDKEKYGSDIDVAHTGFFFKVKDKTGNIRIIFRHASTDFMKITDDDLYAYINRVKVNKKLVGISFYTFK